MKKSRIVGIFLIIVIVLQNIIFYKHYDCAIFTFMIGLSNNSNDPMDAFFIIYILSPIFFMSFYFSESTYKLTHGYGKMYVIRNYSKSKLLIKTLLKNKISLVIIVLLQLLVTLIFKKDVQNIEIQTTLKMLLMYFIGVLSIILLQMFLELFAEPQLSAISLCVFTFISYCAVHFLNSIPFLKYIFFPSLMFGAINGAINNKIQYYFSLIYLIVLTICFVVINVKKFNKSDIF